MSTYTVEMTLGPHTFTIESTDTYDPGATTYVLDVLRIGWTTDESSPAPANPNPVTASFQLLTSDVANLAGLECGTPAFITVKSAGNLIASAAGRLAEPVVSSERRNDVQWAVYTIVVVDYATDPAEVTVNLVRGAEDGAVRIAAIAEAAGITIAPGTLFDFSEFEAGTLAGPALQVLNDHLWQMPSEAFGRPILMAETTAGVLTGYTGEHDAAPQVAITWPPAEFQIINNELTLDFGVPPHAGLTNSGMTIDAGDVDDGISFRQSKGRNLNKVTVTSTAGTFSRTNRSADEPVVELALTSTNTNEYVLDQLALMFLLGAGYRDRWRVESFVWEPSDTELENLQWPLTPDTETGDVTCLQAQVAVLGIPPKLNPSTDLPFYAGTLDGAQVTVAGGRIVVSLVINHRLPLPAESGTLPNLGITWGELRAQIGNTVKYRLGTNVVDPDLTWYETRLARAEV